MSSLIESVHAREILDRTEGRPPVKVDVTTDGNLLVKGYERYSFGYYNFRSIYGSFPTS